MTLKSKEYSIEYSSLETASAVFAGAIQVVPKSGGLGILV